MCRDVAGHGEGKTQNSDELNLCCVLGLYFDASGFLVFESPTSRLVLLVHLTCMLISAGLPVWRFTSFVQPPGQSLSHSNIGMTRVVGVADPVRIHVFRFNKGVVPGENIKTLPVFLLPV